MQGPKLKIIGDCSSCEFTNYNRDYLICEKLSVGCVCIIGKLNDVPVTPIECPFLEKSIAEYIPNYISDLKNSQIIRIKDILKDIFSKNNYEFTYEEFNLDYIRIITGGINKSTIDNFQKLSDYTFEIISNGTDVVIELKKENI